MDVLPARKFGYKAGGENIVMGVPKITALFAHIEVMKSDLHRKNLLDPAFSHMAVGMSCASVNGFNYSVGSDSVRSRLHAQCRCTARRAPDDPGRHRKPDPGLPARVIFRRPHPVRSLHLPQPQLPHRPRLPHRLRWRRRLWRPSRWWLLRRPLR